MSSIRKNRPKNLDLTTIRLPVPGIVSILHRISGALLFLLGIPLLLITLQSIMDSQASYVSWSAVFQVSVVKLVLLLMVWSFLHHLCAGIRYLFLDIHWGVDLANARLTSVLVLAISIVLTVIVGVRLW